VILWELLTGRPLFDEPDESAILHAVLNQCVVAPSSQNPAVPAVLDQIVLRGLSRQPVERFGSARDMALALEHAIGLVTQSELSDWLLRLAGTQLAARARMLQEMQERGERTRESAKLDTVRLAISRAALPRARAYAVLFGIGATALLAAIWALTRDAGAFTRTATATVVTASTGPHATPPSKAPEPLAPVEPAPAAVAEPVPAELPRNATKPADAKPAQRRARAAPVHPSKAVQPVPAAGITCAPPYYVVDRLGVRHPKPECL
jgi:serine/threonine-protein kinase